MKKHILCLLVLGTIFKGFAQVNWSEDVAEIFYKNCTECHNPEGVAPFSLLDYPTAYDYRGLIHTYVEYNLMPPWSADSSFQHYFDERLLTTYERETILEWASSGAPEGDSELAPPPPVYSGEQILPGVPDLTLEMPLYMSKATDIADDYVCISLPTGLTEDRRVKAVEIIPGNRAIVHHCLVYVDYDGSYGTDTVGGDCGGPSEEPLMAGYTPGARPTIFPSTDDFSAGILVPAGSEIVFAMHYPHGSYGEYDQTKINLYFYPEPVDNFREIFAGPLLMNWDFNLPANEETPVEAEVLDIPFDVTAMSVFPHMHLLGKSIESYGINPDGDTLPFVRIPEWDFDWQDFYWFKYMQHVPIGSNIYANGVYDNTLANPHNPSDPPVDVYPGFNTTDEMFLVYFHIMEYWEGDELINIDSLNTRYLSTQFETGPNKAGISVYPNPFNKNLSLKYDLKELSKVSVFVYDLNGKLVRQLFNGEQSPGIQEVVWNGIADDGLEVRTGIYFYSIRINGAPFNGKLIKY